VTFRLYDTATQAVRDFEPLEPGKVGLYHCGLTVQSAPHVGHIRKEVVFDVLRRWLERSGYAVTVIANVTDIDDKILQKEREEGRPWWAIAYANEHALHAAYRVLGCLPPTYEPRATGHIPEMLEMVESLVERGHAYVAADGSGDVYFDVRSWPAYGELSRQRIEDMEAAADADPRGKRDPRDFALWKGHKADEPATASWPAPWGRGRPGWHLECSAMVGKYLGTEFDIHGGGIDLRFPHHENELAQSRAAGQQFARWWMHNAWVTTSGEKMSKSLGNSLLVSEVVKRVRPVELRYYLVAPHYRSHVEFSFERAGGGGCGRSGGSRGSSRRAGSCKGRRRSAEWAAAPVCARLSSPTRWTTTSPCPRRWRWCTTSYARATSWSVTGPSPALQGNLLSLCGGLLAVLGIDPLAEPWAAGVRRRLRRGVRGAVDALVGAALEQRDPRRAKRKDWAAADSCGTPWPLPVWWSGHPVRTAMDSGGRGLMPGNSERRGAKRNPGSKKGPTAGSGGQARRGLRGKGPTPRAEERTATPRRGGRPRPPAPPGRVVAARAARVAAAAPRGAPGGAARSGARETAEVVVGRNSVVEALRAGVPCRRRCTSRSGSTPTTAYARRSSSRTAVACR
jgi:cysteinyl-tRNA synthetase